MNRSIEAAAIEVRDTGQLKSGAMPLSQIVMQSVTSIGPALGVFATFQPGVSLAGVNAPLVYLVDILIVLMLGSTLVHLSRAFPSAGGYFTYVSRTLSPRAGFLVSWAYVIYSALMPGVLFAYLGRILQLALADVGIQIHWTVLFATSAVIVGLIIYRGIEFSGLSMMVIGLVEIGIVLAFSFWGFAAPHDGRISLAPFDPCHISAAQFALAAVFGIFNYTGWESAAPIAEESQNPRRNIPIATVVSIVFNCFLITCCTWGLMLSWGMRDLTSVVNDPAMPSLTLAHHLWGPVWWLILVALANSMIGAGIAFSIVSSRMWFAMGRAGALPAWFASIHPTHHTPSNATWAQIGLFFVVGLGGAALVGIDNVYLVGGLVTVFAAIIIYVAANTGLTLHMWTRRRAEFRWLSHGAFPAISTAVLIALFYKSLFPIPATPIVYAPIIVGVWLLLGLLIVFVLRLSGREDWLQRAAAATEQSSLETSNATS